MSENVKAVVAGAAGRMGKKVVKAIVETQGIELVGAIEDEDHDSIGIDVGIIAGVEKLGLDLMPSTSFFDVSKNFDVVINFTSPEGVENVVDACITYKKSMVIGTTSIPEEAKIKIDTLEKIVPMVLSTNFSIGANVVFALLPKILEMVGGNFSDINITEIHHIGKKDAPSGTAKHIAEIMAKGKGWDSNTAICYALEGQKQPDKLYIVSIRSGSTKGEHRVLIANQSEEIEIIHRVRNRQTFADGAVMAAIFAANTVKGLYDMTDVLNLNPKHSMSCAHH